MTASKRYAWLVAWVGMLMGACRGEPTMKDRWKVPLAVLSVAGLTATMVVVLLVHTLPVAAQDSAAQVSCSGVQVNPGDDLDAIVNSDPRDTATTFCLNAHSDGTAATYNISETLRLKDGDRLIGQTGETVTRGPATYGVPEVNIRPSGSFDKIIAPLGKNIEIQWVDIAGAVGKTTTDGQPQTGTGAGITASSADGGFLLRYAVIHGNDAGGILNAKGRILNSEFYDNTQNPVFLGWNGSAVKGITEFEAAYNYVHNEQGNGIWCDVGCNNDAARENGFWIHDNLTVNNARSGIRYEHSPDGLATGVHASEPTALIEGNEVHGNSYDANRGGISVLDGQNALIRHNVFGAKTIAGVAYRANAAKPGAVKASDWGRSDRTDLWNVDIVDNVLNGEGIRGCELPDDVVDCHDTTSPTVSSVAPTEGAATVALDANVEANFSEAMDTSRITDVTFILKPVVKAATPVAATVSYDPTTNKATLNPNVELQAGKTYSAKVKGGSAGVKDSAGNPLAADKVWSFTTVPPPGPTDTTAPWVTITSPEHTATGVAPSANLTATFSEKIDPAYITTSTFKLFKLNPDGSTTQVTNVSVSLSTDRLVATLNPFGTSTTLLDKSTTYKAVVTTGARDEAGNQLDQNTTTAGLQQKAWSFTVSN
jgi:hypothetical protein